MMKGFWERFSDFLRNSKKVFNADEKLLDMQIIEFPAFFSTVFYWVKKGNLASKVFPGYVVL